MQPGDDLTAKFDAAKRQLEELTAKVVSNDEKMRASQQRELRLLQAEGLEALITEMIVGLKVSYGLQYVSVVLCDPDHDIRHLLQASGAAVESFGHLIMVESLTGMAPQYIALRQPWLGAYAACDHQLLFPSATGLASVAMIPLSRRQKLIGSINLGSVDAARFTGDFAVDFLAHLGVIASFCVENAINGARLLRSGFTDYLTGWYNRRYLQVRVNEEIARARRDNTHLVCLMLDIDHFKRVNDSWGHAAGDVVLQELAIRIESQVRASDVAARYGGEEFVILLPNTDNESGRRLAERVRKAIAAAPVDLPNGDTVSMTASIGIASVQPDPEANDLKILGDSLIARADVALYRAKSDGRDQIAIDES